MNLKVLWTISNSMGTYGDLKMLKEAESFNIEIVTVDRIIKDSIACILTGKKYIVPSGNDCGYIDAVIDICRSERIDVIIPQYTDELIPLSQNIDRFDKMGIKILVTQDKEKLVIANNKKKLYDFFLGSSFLPDYKPISNIRMLREILYEMGYPDIPVCMKPAEGEGGSGFRIVTDEKLNILNDSLQNLKVNLEILERQLSGIDSIPELMAVEYLPGKEYSVDCLCKNGITYICIPRVRAETCNGLATVSIIEKNDEIIEYSKEIISKLNLSFNINIQFKYSADGHPKLIEVNPRVSGSLIANYGAGVNMLDKALRLAYGMPLGRVKINWGTKMIRYWDQAFV